MARRSAEKRIRITYHYKELPSLKPQIPGSPSENPADSPWRHCVARDAAPQPWDPLGRSSDRLPPSESARIRVENNQRRCVRATSARRNRRHASDRRTQWLTERAAHEAKAFAPQRFFRATFISSARGLDLGFRCPIFAMQAIGGGRACASIQSATAERPAFFRLAMLPGSSHVVRPFVDARRSQASSGKRLPDSPSVT